MGTEAALFTSAHSALMFAFNYEGGSKSALACLAPKAPATGKGLGGQDGAGQAGMIQAGLAHLDEIGRAIIAARFAPPSEPCSCKVACCSGEKPNGEWVNAIAIIANHIRGTALAGTTADARARRVCVVRFFTPKGQKEPLAKIAKRLELHEQTISAYASKTAKLLTTLEKDAMTAISAYLTDISTVGAEN